MNIFNQNPQPEAPYVYQEYPKYVEGTIVQNADEEDALRAAMAAADKVDDAPDADRATLMKAAAEKGIKVDGRWSDDKLRAAIEAA